MMRSTMTSRGRRASRVRERRASRVCDRRGGERLEEGVRCGVLSFGERDGVLLPPTCRPCSAAASGHGAAAMSLRRRSLLTALMPLVGHRTAASAGELDTVGGKQEHRNKLNANSCDTVGFGAA